MTWALGYTLALVALAWAVSFLDFWEGSNLDNDYHNNTKGMHE